MYVYVLFSALSFFFCSPYSIQSITAFDVEARLEAWKCYTGCRIMVFRYTDIPRGLIVAIT